MNKIITMTVSLCLCASTALFAADGTWNVAGVGNWATAGNWVGNTIADGAGNVAYITNILNSTITADTRTIGEIRTDTPYSWWITGGLITLNNSGSTPVIETSGGLVINSALAGSSGFDKTGAGKLELYDTTISGDINLNAGSISLETHNAIKNADVKINNGTTLYINDTHGAPYRYANSVTVNSGVIKPVKGTTALEASLTCNDPYDGGNNNVVEVGNATLYLTPVILSAAALFDVTHDNANLIFYAAISGDNNLILRGNNSSGTFHINAPAVHNGDTIFRTYGGNPRLELNVNQAIPVGSVGNRLEFYIDNGASSSLTLDMNDTDQEVEYLYLGLGSQAGQFVEITGGESSLFIVTTRFTDGNAANDLSLRLTGGKLLVEADANYTWINKPIYVADATMILNALWFGNSATVVDVEDDGIVGGLYYGALTIRNGGKVSPGDDDIGTLATGGNVIMEAGSEYDWEYDDTSADIISSSGTLTLPTADNSVTVNVSRLAEVGTTFTLISSTGITGGGSDGVGALVAIDPNDKVTEFTKDGNNINITVTPEPGMFIGLVLVGLAFLRKRV